ncbi:type II toxin-antitoxin system VapC family toxin [Thermococcus sp. MV11]|uniref:type II toxin-antitoxin system VapC family toxin n=1 Tax=Thermococcus sp. MV11 TaxID=1638267 RepID=UPI00142FE4AC|nr:type II toxin-antitoxin system VapC family toxin [Thermococcus sp. MV11]NJE04305.1 type II toxin-antitoxin system VapC family toxin [Thermococcus sp. MV11]
MGAVLDTNVIIEIARGKGEVLDRVTSLDSTFYITSITKFEILLGMPRKDELIWLEALIELPFDGKCAEMAAYLHRKLKEKGTPMSLRDLFVASTAIVNGLPIITLDSDFEVLKELGFEVHVI